MLRKYAKIIPYFAAALVLFLIVHYWDACVGAIGLLFAICIPLIEGCFIAYILNILVNIFEEKVFGRFFKRFWGERLISVVLSILVIVAVVFGILEVVIPELKEGLTTLITGVPTALEQLKAFISNHALLARFIDTKSLDEINVEQIANSFLTWIQNGSGPDIMSAVNSFISLGGQLFMASIFSLYLLGSKEKLKNQFVRIARLYIPDKHRAYLWHVLELLDHSFHNFIVGQVADAVIVGVLCAIGMVILRLPYPVMIGIVIGTTALIPIIGCYIGTAIGAVILLTTSLLYTVEFVVFFGILQQIKSEVIYPKIVGASIGLPGIWVFVAVIIGSGFFGFAGIMFCIPVAATAYQLFVEYIHKKEAMAAKIAEEKERYGN